MRRGPLRHESKARANAHWEVYMSRGTVPGANNAQGTMTKRVNRKSFEEPAKATFASTANELPAIFQTVSPGTSVNRSQGTISAVPGARPKN